MHGKRRLIHKGIIFAVEPADVSGFYRFRFQIGDKTIEGRVETNLKGMAIHRARAAINRRLQKASPHGLDAQ